MKNKSKLALMVIILVLASCSNPDKSETEIHRKPPNKVPNFPLSKSVDAAALEPEDVVALYFQSLDGNRTDIAYSLISEEFKNTESTAKTQSDFQDYMNLLLASASSTDIIQAKSSFNDGSVARVGYKIEIEKKDGSRKLFNSQFTLKKKPNGWKLTDPYQQ